MILHPSTQEIIVIMIAIGLLLYAVSLVAYRIGKYDGMSEGYLDQILDFEKQLRMYEDLLRRYDELKEEAENGFNNIESEDMLQVQDYD